MTDESLPVVQALPVQERSLRFAGFVLQPRIYRDPVRFPGLASIIRE